MASLVLQAGAARVQEVTCVRVSHLVAEGGDSHQTSIVDMP